jgi:uncharacterized protein YyaL (SSP411 family)
MTARPGPRENRLSLATSPYLRQHAHQPVDWYPWGPEALERARREDRPILLSIGYAACHWCHVMARESFDDAPTATLMNELFVSIKVDREERPDLDRIYQMAQTIITQQGGGWPLTMFLSPDDHMPIFGGTYFPPTPRHGLPAFPDLLRRVARYWREQRRSVHEQGEQLRTIFASLLPEPAPRDTQLDRTPLVAARAALERRFDREAGGFGGPPKFPQPGSIERLLRDWAGSQHGEAPDLQALYMATLTLTRMAEGGLRDHVGGGFARYSVDGAWRIPHFEKMLYDNGALLALYAQTSIATGDPLYADAAHGTADWALREMQAPHGGFHSSLDADSEGEEGRYYVWSREEIASLLPDDEFAVMRARYGLDGLANFEGRWHLAAVASLADTATASGHCSNGTGARLASALARLREARERRVHPALDDKVLTGWNGLMVRGLAIAARALDRADLEVAATRAVDFLRSRLWRDGRLLASHASGRAGGGAYLDDHAFLGDALLELLQVRWRASDLDFAIDLAEAMLRHFEDRDQGGFWFTADDAERLVHRPKPLTDEATPAGNGVAARVLLRLGCLIGEPRYLAAAERALRAAWPSMLAAPEAHAALLDALEEYLTPTEVVVLRGPATVVEPWRTELARLYAPKRFVVAIPTEATGLPEALAAKPASAAGVAYVCAGTRCDAPIESFGLLVRRLRDGIGA